MKILLDAFWRAVAYCLRPRVILLSLLPFVVMLLAGLAFAQWGWWPAVDTVLEWLEGTTLLATLHQALDWLNLPQFKNVIAPLVVVFSITPLIVLASLLLVAGFMTPALVKLVAERRFPQLERKHGASLLASIGWSLGHTVLALLLLLFSIPLWFIPPLVLIVPPLIWGWLSYRVMSFDAWSEHASKPERRQLMQRHRTELLIIGIITGLLGTAPSIVWASATVFLVAFAVLIPAAIWIYMLVFAFSSLWFVHFCLAVLQQQRQQEERERAAFVASQPGFDVGSRPVVPVAETLTLPAAASRASNKDSA